jgi:hypothetical protein
MKNIKKQYDINFYNSLEPEVREIISLQEFLSLENTSPNKLIHKIDEYARVTKFEGNNFDKTLHFIYSLDLDIDKIGKILSKSDYIKYEDIEEIAKENGWV